MITDSVCVCAGQSTSQCLSLFQPGRLAVSILQHKQAPQGTLTSQSSKRRVPKNKLAVRSLEFSEPIYYGSDAQYANYFLAVADKILFVKMSGRVLKVNEYFLLNSNQLVNSRTGAGEKKKRDNKQKESSEKHQQGRRGGGTGM